MLVAEAPLLLASPPQSLLGQMLGRGQRKRTVIGDQAQLQKIPHCLPPIQMLTIDLRIV